MINAFTSLSEVDQQAVVAFLETLKLPIPNGVDLDDVF